MRSIQDIDAFWQLTLKPETADTRLSNLPVVIVSRATFHRFFRELRHALGADAERVFYQSGLEAGEAIIGLLTKWTGTEDPNELVDHLCDIDARCGWFAVDSLEVDPASRQARLRLKKTLETYGIEGREGVPTCHFLRGYLAGFFRSLFWSDTLECLETACRGKGDRFCEFVIANSGPGAPAEAPPGPEESKPGS